MSIPNEQRRSERSRQAILEAALDLCRERGLARMTVEQIAKRAGVGKQTIYRWWGSKAAVVQDALNELVNTATAFPDTGDLRADLRTQMTAVAKAFASAEFAPYASLIAAAQDDPDLAATVRKNMIDPRVRDCAERLRRGQEQEQLRKDVDVNDVVELLYAPLYYRLLLRTRPVTPEQVTEVLDLTFAGLAPDSAADGAPSR